MSVHAVGATLFSLPFSLRPMDQVVYEGGLNFTRPCMCIFSRMGSSVRVSHGLPTVNERSEA